MDRGITCDDEGKLCDAVVTEVGPGKSQKCCTRCDATQGSPALERIGPGQCLKSPDEPQQGRANGAKGP